MNDWTPVAERVPKDHPRRCYLVVYVGSAHGTPRKAKRRVLFAIYSGGLWRFMGAQKETRLSERVTHWMRKPRPPRLPSPAERLKAHMERESRHSGSKEA
jgi:hypothetical protein